jgi:hypothetical protein
MTHKDAAFGIAGTVEWLFNLTGPTGTGLDNAGQLDQNYQTVYPGFPTFAQISGIPGDGYSAGD